MIATSGVPNYKKTIRIGWSFSFATYIIIDMFGIKPSKFTEICGWYGMTMLVLAYALVSFKITPADGIVFQLMNLTGSIGLMIVTMSKKVVQSVLLNLFWAIIGVAALIGIIF